MNKALSVLAAIGLVLGTSGMAAAAGTATGTVTASATLENSCTVSDDATMTFPNSAALLSTADQTADTGTTLKVACTTGTSPTIWSDTPRILVNGPDSFPFNLSQVSGAASNDLPTTAPGQGIPGYIADGSEKVVHLYGKIMASNFGGLPGKLYAANITVTVSY